MTASTTHHSGAAFRAADVFADAIRSMPEWEEWESARAAVRADASFQELSARHRTLLEQARRASATGRAVPGATIANLLRALEPCVVTFGPDAVSGHADQLAAAQRHRSQRHPHPASDAEVSTTLGSPEHFHRAVPTWPNAAATVETALWAE